MKAGGGVRRANANDNTHYIIIKAELVLYAILFSYAVLQVSKEACQPKTLQTNPVLINDSKYYLPHAN